MSSTLARARQLLAYFSSSKPPTSPLSVAVATTTAPQSAQFSTATPITNNMATGNDQKITHWVNPSDPSGEFKRGQSAFRNWISREPGARFPPEKGRYHLYVSYACPWAHRTLIARKLKGLEDIISFTSVHWHLGDLGWRFATAEENLPGENTGPDLHHQGFEHLRQIYFDVDPEYKGRFTVPTLYDTKTKTIVSNESSEIIRMFYYEFDDLLPEEYRKVDLFPEHLRKDIEATNEWTYNDVNNGVYKCGFKTRSIRKSNRPLVLLARPHRITLTIQDRHQAFQRYSYILLRRYNHRSRHPPLHHHRPLRPCIRAAFQDEHSRHSLRIPRHPPLAASFVLGYPGFQGNDTV
ncbi:glutathione S-transferase [Histoplasma capsulatum var. duboisii H88]|uniref:Glutathione S-transferase n=1 Tax=Ajellomyces capsulatus (strain H88) TaxID=544711 RepID=F0UNE5_AJEC8|nr:glutathione S-transferase [Histoplasma capsulatum var. duboisii H88]